MKQVNAVPDRAATFVVHPTPGIGDATTIQDALDMLPAEGGAIFLREGTFSLSATVTLPAGKPVSIRGTGNSTVIDLGANVIAAFTIPTGAVTNTPIILDALKVTGNEAAGQAFLEYADANSLAEIYIENLVTVGVEKTINVTSSTSASASPGADDARFHLFRCRIRPNTTNSSVILSNPSIGLPRAWLTEVEFIGDSLFAIPGGRTAPLFGLLASNDWFGDCYLDSCELSIGTGESDFATFESTNSTVWNNDNVNTLVIYGLNGNFEGLAAGNIQNSSFRGIHFQAFENSNFFSSLFQDSALELFGDGTVVGDNDFQQVSLSPWPLTFVVIVNNNDMVVRDNRWKFSAPPAQVLDLEAPCTVNGNDFSEVHPGANGSVFIDNGDCIITDNRFTFAPTTGPNLKEVNGPTMYDNNVSLFWETSGPIVGTITPLGNGSTIQGMLDFNAAGAVGGVATNSIVVNYRNPYGLSKFQGYIQNTGGVNNITVREQYFTQNEGTFTRSTVLTPGSKLILDPYNFAGLGAIDNQVVKYTADVSGTNIAWHTYFGAPDGVTDT